MIMPPLVRKSALILHVTCSVGWFGAVATFLALAVVGLTSQDVQLVGAVYVAMDVITTLVIVPLSLASLLTGLIQSLGTRWGLFQHYWVVAKLLITVVSVIILLTHTEGIRYMAGVAAAIPLASDDFPRLRFQLAVSAGAALLALLLTTILSVYRPRGLTPYGRRKQQGARTEAPDGDIAI